MSDRSAKATIKSVDELLQMNLQIPNYQRPYKWTSKNVSELLEDIDTAMNDSQRPDYNGFKYRVGSVILHKHNDQYDIVDGQQRIITLSLIKHALDNSFQGVLSTHEFADIDSQKNIYDNYLLICKRLANGRKEALNNAFSKDGVLEVVVLEVTDISEAFQLFDSQNTRGKALDPHDLLKAYHLREMKNCPFEQLNLVTRWEEIKPEKIRDLFSLYLYPILNWSRKEKTYEFTAQNIDTYKGADLKCSYTYAQRIRKAMPCFQINQSFSAGGDFFLMVEHYIQLLDDLKNAITNNYEFNSIKNILERCIKYKKNEGELYTSIGSRHAETLFYCALLFYYDRFHELDKMAVENLFAWAMMIRVDMNHLGFDTINNYAIGNGDKDYSNQIPMFYRIATAHSHKEIGNLPINTARKSNAAKSQTWNPLYDEIKRLMKVKQ